MKNHVSILLAATFLIGCGSGPQSPVAQPQPSNAQIVYQGPGIPGSNTVQELYTSNLDGTHLSPLTHDGLNHFLAHFSPDGTKLLYSKFLAGQYGDPSPPTDIAVYDFATGKETELTSVPEAFQPAWSPDGLHIATGTYQGGGIWIMNADGSGLQKIAQPSGAVDDLRWADLLWTSDNWLVFTVAQNVNNCFKARIDKMRPDGTSRTQVTDGGANCTPPGMENYGDADPGASPDGQTIYSSRGLSPLAASPAQTLRHLYAFSSGEWVPAKLERDLSQAAYPNCIVGVPKASPDGTRVMVSMGCTPAVPSTAIWVTDTTGTFWTLSYSGFGADWNPAWKP